MKLHECTFSHTIMFVWFDFEEANSLGSFTFVNEYLYPEVLEKYGSSFIGAYMADMILISEAQNGTQIVPDFIPTVSTQSGFHEPSRKVLKLI